ncbi:ELM1/GtrOC1 family putative glycosyltransferase [Sulfurovum sp. CS9]|uniref:ELM1/GtrOC1 family putative glycosyltransferase n=1 Tax=Sulfurovum sp. CS9 TaxID=3391146 RepID=UPI0039E96E09
MSRILILSDGRAGHLNQSIALAKYLELPYDVVEVLPKYRWSKALTYLLDKLGIRTKFLFEVELYNKEYSVVVGTGSWTYYMVKVLGKTLKARSITMMLPRGYKYDFDTIFAQSHDNPPKQKNIIEIPANFSYVEPQGLYVAKKHAIGIVIGGDNKIFTMSKEKLQSQLDFIVKHYQGYEIAITTSPRTSEAVEQLIESYHFEYEVIFSKNTINPIPDFLELCETVFITGDSTSMISEAIAYGVSNVIVLPLESKEDNKFERFVKGLEREGYLYIFDGTIKNRNKKINFKEYLRGLDL